MSQDPHIRRTIDESVAGSVPPAPSLAMIERRARSRQRRRVASAGAACLAVAGLTWAVVTPGDDTSPSVASDATNGLSAEPVAPEEIASFCLETLGSPVPQDLTVSLGEASVYFETIDGSGLDRRADVCRDVINQTFDSVEADSRSVEASPEQEEALADDLVTREEYEDAVARLTDCSAASGFEVTPTFIESAGKYDYQRSVDVDSLFPGLAYDACFQWHVADVEEAFVFEAVDPGVPLGALAADAAELLAPIDAGAEDWLYPGELPPGVEFERAFDPGPPVRQLVFTDGTQEVLWVAHIDPHVIGDRQWEPHEMVAVGDAIWFLDETWGLVRETASGWVAVRTADPSIDERRIAASIAVRPVSALPRPPLDLIDGDFAVVTSAEMGGREVAVAAQTDGVFIATRVGEEPASCCHQLTESDLVVVTGYGTSDDTAGGLVEGIAASSVAKVVITFTSGDVLELQPEDRSGVFPVGFFVGSAPDGPGAFITLVESMTAFDADGASLGSADLTTGLTIREVEA
ncbi:MAG: hypothetical protein AAGA37_23685 [Actinomycetota bacterium]